MNFEEMDILLHFLDKDLKLYECENVCRKIHTDNLTPDKHLEGNDNCYG